MAAASRPALKSKTRPKSPKLSRRDVIVRRGLSWLALVLRIVGIASLALGAGGVRGWYLHRQPSDGAHAGNHRYLVPRAQLQPRLVPSVHRAKAVLLVTKPNRPLV